MWLWRWTGPEATAVADADADALADPTDGSVAGSASSAVHPAAPTDSRSAAMATTVLTGGP